MSGRRGFSLVEMVIVLVLAGIVSTAAINMFSTQNRLHAAMTALGESQEGARSAVQLVSSELRAARGGNIQVARGDRIVLRVPLVIGVVCGQRGPNNKAVYVQTDRTLDLRDDIDGYSYLDRGVWISPNGANPNAATFGGAREACRDHGHGDGGTDAEYVMLQRIRDAEIGAPVMLYREITYSFGPSGLDPDRRAFFRSRNGDLVELGHGFSMNTRFEYMLNSRQEWASSVGPSNLRDIGQIRIVAEVVGRGSAGGSTRSATYSLTREIPVRGF